LSERDMTGKAPGLERKRDGKGNALAGGRGKFLGVSARTTFRQPARVTMIPL